MSKGTILVVEPDEELRERLKIELKAEDYTVIDVSSGVEMILPIRIADVLYHSVEDEHDWKFVQRVSSTSMGIYVIAAVQRGMIEDRIGEFGIEPECISKPFSIRELKARIEGLLQRGKS